MSDVMPRWRITVSEETDRSVRALLKEQGIERGGLSRFIRESVQQHLISYEMSLDTHARRTHPFQREVDALIEKDVVKAKRIF